MKQFKDRQEWLDEMNDAIDNALALHLIPGDRPFVGYFARDKEGLLMDDFGEDVILIIHQTISRVLKQLDHPDHYGR